MTLNAELIFLALFFIPVLAAFIGVLIIAAHPKTYHYSPVHEFEGRDPINPLIHAAVGALQAVTTDLSSGNIQAPQMYTRDMYNQLYVELQSFAPYVERGYRLQYYFYHNDRYEADVYEMIAKNDVVVEILGIFDYFVEREGVRRVTPHEYDTREPFVREPARVRVRLQSTDGLQWRIAGFSDSAREFSVGLPTA